MRRVEVWRRADGPRRVDAVLLPGEDLVVPLRLYDSDDTGTRCAPPAETVRVVFDKGAPLTFTGDRSGGWLDVTVAASAQRLEGVSVWTVLVVTDDGAVAYGNGVIERRALLT